MYMHQYYNVQCTLATVQSVQRKASSCCPEMRALCTFSTRACPRATSSLAALSAAGLSTCGPWAGATDEATTPAVNANVDGCGPGVDGGDDAGELDGTCPDRVMGDGAGAKAAGVHAGQHDGGHAGVEGGGGEGQAACAQEWERERLPQKKTSLTAALHACDVRL